MGRVGFEPTRLVVANLQSAVTLVTGPVRMFGRRFGSRGTTTLGRMPASPDHARLGELFAQQLRRKTGDRELGKITDQTPADRRSQSEQSELQRKQTEQSRLRGAEAALSAEVRQDREALLAERDRFQLTVDEWHRDKSEAEADLRRRRDQLDAEQQAVDQELAELRRQVAASMDDPRFVAIGEIGLDFFIPDPNVERQNAVYQAQLRIAREFDLPVLMHVRKSQDQVRSAAAKAGVRGIAHAFNGSPDQARAYVDSGFKLGFGGVFTFSRANRVRRLAAEMPIESIVLETDAPDLAPAWLADDQFSEQVGTRNAPAEVAGIAAAMAELRGISIDALAAQARRNSIEAIPRLAALLTP